MNAYTWYFSIHLSLDDHLSTLVAYNISPAYAAGLILEWCWINSGCNADWMSSFGTSTFQWDVIKGTSVEWMTVRNRTWPITTVIDYDERGQSAWLSLLIWIIFDFTTYTLKTALWTSSQWHIRTSYWSSSNQSSSSVEYVPFLMSNQHLPKWNLSKKNVTKFSFTRYLNGSVINVIKLCRL